MTWDLILKGGTVIDGTGAPARPADVAVTGGRIAAVGDLAGGEAAATLDCTGLTLAPGFIDIHSHADWLLPGSDHGALLEPFIRQGMTTVLGGNCGFSPAPLTAMNREAVQETSRLLIDADIALQWETTGEFLDALAAGGVALNIAELVGHGSVRAAVTGVLTPDAPTADELAQMERLTREALDAGCVGVSTGLGYPPGIFSEEEELRAFAGWAAADNKLFTSHLKAYSWLSGAYATDPTEEAHNVTATKDVLRIAQQTGARLQISHLIFVGRHSWASYGDILRVIEDAHAAGVDVGFDAFPYTAGNTVATVVLPPQLLPRLEEALDSPDDREGLENFIDAASGSVGLNLGDMQIMRANAPNLNRYDGLRLTEAAEREGISTFDFYCRLVVESNRTARVLIHTYSGDAGAEEPLRAVLAHPRCTFETDTLLTGTGFQNPASYGTFPRLLSTYVREGLFTLEEAVRKMTGAAAERLGWTDRGYVREGCAGDLVVMDTATLQDNATFEHPDRFPTGIEHVFINGRHVVNGDRYDAGARAGEVLRS